MRHIFAAISLLLLLVSSCTRESQPSFPAYSPVSYKQVTITDDFWLAKIDSNQQNGIPSCFESCDYSLENFDIAAGLSDSTRKGTEATDSDVYKIIQGAAHALDHHPDPVLELFIDSLINRIEAAQWEDGYLNTYWSINDPSQRWTRIETRHELYCAGHFFEAAAAYYEVTGKRKILNMAIKLADHIDSVFGPGKIENVSGHQEIELALIRLYEVTNDEKYFKLAQYFLEERGNPDRLAYKASPEYVEPNVGTPKRFLTSSYRQDHKPVKDQRKAIGHAVRAAYMYSGMADFARVSGSEEYLPALNAIWDDIVSKKIYVTGSIGTAQFHDEGFGSDYSLPNESAYCETCSAIALMLWNHKMAALTGDPKFADLFELTLYNGGISGGSAAGDRFFYTNPLEGKPGHKRNPWYEPGCCPSNFVRFIPQIDQFIYGQNERTIYINQFIGSELTTEVNGKELVLKQSSGYPWSNSVEIQLQMDSKINANLMIRIPGWAQGKFYPGDLYTYSKNTNVPLSPESEASVGEGPGVRQTGGHVTLNGTEVYAELSENGYLSFNRKWKNGDIISIKFNMDVRLAEANPLVKDVKGQQVLTRGPVVYCLEGIDNPEILDNPDEFKFTPDNISLNPIDSITHGILQINGVMKNTTGDLHRFSAIPYFAWRNRGATKMQVWF